MKMILAIINSDDAGEVIRSLVQGGYKTTKLSSTGGFLRAGNVTILVGIEEERLEDALSIIKGHSRSRMQAAPLNMGNTQSGGHYITEPPVEVPVGGATIFVLDVDHYEKV